LAALIHSPSPPDLAVTQTSAVERTRPAAAISMKGKTSDLMPTLESISQTHRRFAARTIVVLMAVDNMFATTGSTSSGACSTYKMRWPVKRVTADTTT